MKMDPLFTLLVSRQLHWSPQERQDFGLLPSKQAQEHLQAFTERDGELGFVGWCLYCWLKKGEHMGLRVLVGSVTGENRRLLRRATQRTAMQTTQATNEVDAAQDSEALSSFVGFK